MPRSNPIALRRARAFTFLLVATVGCQPVADSPPPPTPVVRVRPVVEGTVAPKIDLVGTVTPLRVSRLAAGVAGKIAVFDYEEGQVIAPDRPIAELRRQTIEIEIEAAKAAERKSTAADSLAKSREKRVTTARDRGTVNVETLEAAQSEAAQAAAALAAAAAEVKRLEDRLAQHTINPPFHGPLAVLVQKQTDIGEWVDEGDPLATIADLSHVKVVVTVEEKFIQLARIGRKIEVRFDPASGPRGGGLVTVEGEVMHIVPRANWQQGSRSFPVHIRVENRVDEQGQPLLKEGMLARVTLEGESRKALKIHKDCLVRTSGRPVVFRLDKDNRARPIEVKLGLLTGDYVEYVPGGGDPSATSQASPPSEESADTVPLQPGDRLVSDGAERLRPMQQVTVLPNPATVSTGASVASPASLVANPAS